MSAAGGALPHEPGERLVALVHDLRTPLTVVGGFAELLVSRGETLAPEQREEYLARLAEAAGELRSILDAERASRGG